jgi:hypothetical protein
MHGSPLHAPTRLILGALALSLLTACGSTTTYTGTSQAPVRTRQEHALSVGLRTLDYRALQREPQRNLNEVIRYYWPDVMNPPWAMLTGSTSEADRVGVFIDGMYMGGLELFNDVPVSEIQRVQRMTPTEERVRFGRMHSAGAILVEWKKPADWNKPR